MPKNLRSSNARFYEKLQTCAKRGKVAFRADF